MSLQSDPLLQHPDRVHALEGASNFRDLGGYPAADGRRVRWGRVYRSAHLGALSDADIARLHGLGVKRVVDFRGVQERAATPNRWPEAAQLPLTIEPTVAQRLQSLAEAGSSITAPVVQQLMCELYAMLVEEQAARFAALFEALLEGDEALVFHCTAGKDRTGVAAALLLSALGVPRAVVEADYLLTNQHYRRPALPATETPPEVLEVLWTVQPAFLHTALARIDARPGGMDGYLRTQLGLTPAAQAHLRTRLLD